MGEHSQIIEEFRGKFHASKTIRHEDILDFIQKFQEGLASEDARKNLDSQWIVEIIAFVALAATKDKNGRRFWAEEDIAPLLDLLEAAQAVLGDPGYKKRIQSSALLINQAQIIIRDPYVTDRTYINAYLLLDQAKKKTPDPIQALLIQDEIYRTEYQYCLNSCVSRDSMANVFSKKYERLLTDFAADQDLSSHKSLDQWELNAKTHYLRILAQVGGSKYEKRRKELAIEVENGQKAVNNRPKIIEARLLAFGYAGFRIADILSKIVT